MPATKPRKPAEKKQEALWLANFQRPLWDTIQKVAGPRTKLQLRFPTWNFEPNRSNSIRLLFGLEFTRSNVIDPYANVPQQVANELRGWAAELLELAAQIADIPHMPVDDTGTVATAA